MEFAIAVKGFWCLVVFLLPLKAEHEDKKMKALKAQEALLNSPPAIVEYMNAKAGK